MAEERVDACDGLGGIERGGAGCDAVGRERGLRGGGDGFLREWVRERFERGVVLECEVRAFVGFDEDEDGRGVFVRRVRGVARVSGIFGRSSSVPQRDPVRSCEAVRVALPAGERRDVVAFSCHGRAESGEVKMENEKRIGLPLRH
jgi:hypothetical protein